MWSPSVCSEACLLLARFSGSTDTHITLLQGGAIPVLFQLTCTHAEKALSSVAELQILLQVGELVANLLPNPDLEVRNSVTQHGNAQRLAALLGEVCRKERVKDSPVDTDRYTRKIDLVVTRINENLKLTGEVSCLEKASERDKKYYLNREVYMLTQTGSWKAPK